MKKVICLLMAVMMIMIMAACSDMEAEPIETTGSDGFILSNSILGEDHEFTYNAVPQRIVSLASPATEMLLALGLEENIAGYAIQENEIPEKFQGALDVFTTPIGMKKSRPGVMLTVLCKEEDKERMARLIFQHTTTLGIRETRCGRYTLKRRTETVDTPCGPVCRKISTGYGVGRSKYEYEDLVRIAAASQCSIQQVLERIE